MKSYRISNNNTGYTKEHMMKCPVTSIAVQFVDFYLFVC